MKISFKLNGKTVTVDVEPNEILLDVLRLKLGIKSVKRGCERAECGTCTVLLDGKPVYSCVVLAPQVDGKEVVTVDYLADKGELNQLVNAFIDVGAIQCGYCTPGFLVTSYALLSQNPKPTLEEIKKSLEGNICRCTGYKKIIEAVAKAANVKNK
jgi:carbon-monoxide dehydrogenase small subunit